MGKQCTLLLGLAMLFLITGHAIGQVKPKTEIASVKQNGKTIDFTLTSAKPFIFGSNRYILNIGDKSFFLHKQRVESGKGIITFYIPADDFSRLKEGDGIYLTYGNIFRDESEAQKEELSKENGRCWALGKFNKGLLVK